MAPTRMTRKRNPDALDPARERRPPRSRTAGPRAGLSLVVLDAVAAGDVTPDEAGRVMALLTAHKALVETGDLESRITALEAKK